jgi:ABC-type microcin C transport system permease subunit YejB
MGKYTDRRKEVIVEKDLTKNVMWKGIGCTLMIVIPAISIAAAMLTVASPTTNAYIPDQLMGYPILPNALFATEGLSMIFYPISQTEDLYAIIVVSLGYMVVLGSLISAVYAAIYRVINPRTYGPFDAPPSGAKAKKYKR